MKIVVQRVKKACVKVEGEVIGEIASGFLILLGITHGDSEAQADKLVEKISKLRVFEDPSTDSGQAGKMNNNIADTKGDILVISQFTLYGDCRKGNRPSFIKAARPEVAEPLYQYFVKKIREKGIGVKTGKFGAYMEVELVNDGPTTFILES